MADNTAQNGTAVIATDDVTTLNGGASAGVQVQRMKVGFGDDNSYRDASTTFGLPVVQTANSLVSTGNSTTVNLAAAGIFTGTAEDASEYSTIMVTAFADQVSATDGLQIQQSSNGTNWDIADSFSIPASTGKIFSFGVAARFARVVYTNGATTTTALRIQVIYSKLGKKNSSVRPQDGRTNDNDFEEQLSFAMGYNGTSWDRLRATTVNGLAVDVTRMPTTPVTGTFFQATQPVSGAFFQTTQPVSGAFFQATQPVSIAASVAVTGAFFQTTQPISLATNTPTIAAGTAIIGKVGIDQTTPGTTNLVSIGTNGTVAINAALPTGANTIGAVTNTNLDVLLSTRLKPADTLTAVTTVTTVSAVTAITNALPVGANVIGQVLSVPSPLAQSAIGTTAAALTITLPLVSGQFHYITSIDIVRVSTAAVTGTAVLGITSTNLPGTLAWSTGNAIAIGALVVDVRLAFPSPIKSSVAATATTIVMPVPGTGVQWRANVTYYTAA